MDTLMYPGPKKKIIQKNLLTVLDKQGELPLFNRP